MHQVLEKVHNNKIQKGNRSRIVHLIPKTKEVISLDAMPG